MERERRRFGYCNRRKPPALSISENETSTRLIVKAVSKADGGNYATAVVEVNAGVSEVKLTPEKVYVERGDSYQFDAEVIGENNPVDTIVWSVTGGLVGTTIDTNGCLTVAADETAESVTVRAASAADSSKYAEAVVVFSPLTRKKSISTILKQRSTTRRNSRTIHSTNMWSQQ